ncbi:MAG TPA: biotin--[acetyl-CoA-carboxylase] ligase [Pseudonocardia sp.]
MEYQPLDVDALRAELGGMPGGTVAGIEVVARTGSTNADLASAASAGAPDRTVLVAELQDAGRGRLDRRWSSPPGAGLTFSVLLRPIGVAPNRLGWLPLLAGVALLRTVRALRTGDGGGPDAVLKWPNDLLLGPARAKCAGLLAEVPTPNAVVLGIGLNVHTSPEQLPSGVNATSLRAQGIEVSRTELLVALLRNLLADEADWRAAGGDPVASGLLEAYRRDCATIGAKVRIEQPGGTAMLGTARDVDVDGRLVLCQEDGTVRGVAAGDVVHLRADS